jgi:hypothetical protein
LEHFNKQESIALNNPYLFIKDHLLPSLTKQNGGKALGEGQLIAKLGQLYGSRVGEAVSQIMAIQQAIIEKDADNQRRAMGLEGQKFLNENDPISKMQSLTASFQTLMGSIASSVTPAALEGMDRLAGMFRKFAHSSGMDDFGAATRAFMGGVLGKRDETPDYADRPFQSAANADVQAEVDAENRKSLIEQWRANGQDFLAQIKSAVEELRAFGQALSAITRFVNSITGGGKDKAQPNPHSDYIEGPFERAAKAAAEANRKTEVPGIRGMFDGKAAVPASHSLLFGRSFGSDYTLGSPGGFNSGPMNRASTWGKVPGWTSEGVGKLPTAGIGGQIGNGIAAEIDGQVKGITHGKGIEIMQSIADGMKAGVGAVTGVMTSTMGQLQAIGAQGVTIPVKIDSAGAQSQINALVNNGFRAATSKALNDNGGLH